MVKCCKLYSLICDPDGKMWIFRFSLGVCPIELCNLVFSLECLVSNGRQALLGGIRLGGSAIVHRVDGVTDLSAPSTLVPLRSYY